MTGEEMNSQQRSEDDLEFSRAVEVLTRLRCRQGASALTRAMREAAKLDMLFCATCGQETGHEGDLCAECGTVTNPETVVGRSNLATRREHASGAPV